MKERGASARRAATADSPQGPRLLSTVTLDGSLLGAAGLPGQPQPPQRVALPPPRSPGAARLYLDKGETEAAYLDTLRSHFVRNSTAEPAIPPNRTFRKYSAATAAASRPAPPGGAAGVLQQREAALWDEREHELLDAQEVRFAQLEDALRAREEKREAYVVHRLEAAAADKLALLARQRGRLSKQKAALAQHAQYARLGDRKPASAAVTLPALPKAALRPVLPASPTLAAAVQEARSGLSSFTHISNLHSGLESKEALTARVRSAALPQDDGGRRPWADRKQATYSRQLDSVFASLQALKSATAGRAAHPLEPLLVRRAPPAGRPPSGQLATGTDGAGLGLDTSRAAAVGPADIAALDEPKPTEGQGNPILFMAQPAAVAAAGEGSSEGEEEPIEVALLAHKQATLSEAAETQRRGWDTAAGTALAPSERPLQGPASGAMAAAAETSCSMDGAPDSTPVESPASELVAAGEGSTACTASLAASSAALGAPGAAEPLRRRASQGQPEGAEQPEEPSLAHTVGLTSPAAPVLAECPHEQGGAAAGGVGAEGGPCSAGQSKSISARLSTEQLELVMQQAAEAHLLHLPPRELQRSMASDTAPGIGRAENEAEVPADIPEAADGRTESKGPESALSGEELEQMLSAVVQKELISLLGITVSSIS